MNMKRIMYMKQLSVWSFAALLCSSLLFASCDDDAVVASYLSGTWEGTVFSEVDYGGKSTASRAQKLSLPMATPLERAIGWTIMAEVMVAATPPITFVGMWKIKPSTFISSRKTATWSSTTIVSPTIGSRAMPRHRVVIGCA